MEQCDISACPDYAEVAQICEGSDSLTYHKDSNVLCMAGRIGTKGYAGILAEQVAALPLRSGVRVGLASEGGSLAGAIDLVEVLEDYDYWAIVHGICASACAQFLFLGSEHKVVIGDGLLAMHGGPQSHDGIRSAGYEPHVEARLMGENDRFRAFFEEREIDISITYDFPQDLLDRMAAGEMVFWPVSRQSFAKKGITNITYCDAQYENVNE